jgi:MFS family permease
MFFPSAWPTMTLLQQPQPGLDAPDLDARCRRRGLLMLGLAVALVGAAMAFQLGLNANYLKQDIGVSGREMGIIEAVRESCGILALPILALLAGLGEPLVGAAVLAIFAVGLGSYAITPSYVAVIIMSVVWSQGLHIWMPLPHSMTLALAQAGQAGRRLGQITAAGSIGFAGGLGIALLLSLLSVPMRPMYYVAGGAALAAGACCFCIPRGIKTPGPRLVFRRRYWLYYLLCFLDGWRRQIFVAFAALLLVERFDADLTTILVLNLCVQGIFFLAAGPVGRLIDRIGERPVLVVYFAGVSLFFALYSLLDNKWLLYALFVVDHAFFIFGLAVTTYVNRIAPKSEHTPTLSMGVAINHVAAVLMPLVGGILWVTFGPEWTFRAGMLAALLSLACTRLIPRRATAEQK